MLEQNLSKDFQEQKEKYKKELNQILEQRRVISKDRLKCLYKMTRCVICKETLSKICEAHLFQLNELQTQYDALKTEKDRLLEEQRELKRKREELREIILEMRAYIYTQSGLFHCKNNPVADDYSCKCGTPTSQCQAQTQLVQDVFNRRFPRDKDRCFVVDRIRSEK